MTDANMVNAAIVVAGGTGARLGFNIPKAFVKLGRWPLIRYSLDIFQKHADIKEIVVVVPKGFEKRTVKLCRAWGIEKIIAVVSGGAERQDSVRLGLEALVSRNVQNVFIHDAARPLLKQDLITRLVSALKKHEAVIPVVPLKDTPKELMKEGGIRSTALPRDRYILAQTPQAARYIALKSAYDRDLNASVQATDDAMILELSGVDVQAIMGDDQNLKITTPDDMSIAKTLLAGRLLDVI